MSQGQNKVTVNKWKNKAIARGLENKRLRHQIKELHQSRADWKAKYMAVKQQKNQGVFSDEKAFGHQYSLSMVLFLVMLQRYGNMSLRACRECLVCLSFVGFSCRIPSHNSIRNWACKCGYFRTHSNPISSSDYVVYVDESIVFGSEKILLILGLPVANLPTDSSVSHADMEVLSVGISHSWTGEDIAAELQKIKDKRGISYIVSDEGCNLRSAYKQGNYTHIEDCTHILSNIMKRFYEKDTRFEAFRSFVGKTRQSFYLSKEKSAFLPPCLRGKLRFVNIFSCVAWAKNQLAAWDKLPLELQENLSFLRENEAFIDELSSQHFIFTEVCRILKNQGFSQRSRTEITALLSGFGKNEKVKEMVVEVIGYLDKLNKKCDALSLSHCLCSSDIIESFFGKFKHKINPNNKNKLSEFVVTIANFGKEFEAEEVKKALENVKIKDLKNFKKNNKSGQKK